MRTGTEGARLLAARLGAGVPPGAMIELIGDRTPGSRLCPADNGTVRDAKPDGNLVVGWERA